MANKEDFILDKKYLPNLIIAGTFKAGTTSLFHELSNHPNICASKIKETRYFKPLLSGGSLPPIELYQKNFKHHKKEQYVMEASPIYFYGGEKIALKIKETLGDVKIIIMLRDPVHHLFSTYKHALRLFKINKNESFDDYINNAKKFPRELYDNYIEDWFMIFGDSVKCLFFEHLINSPHKVISDLYSWLGITNEPYKNKQLKNVNIGGVYKSRILHKISVKIFKKVRDDIPFNVLNKIRNIYYSMNALKDDPTITNDTKLYLESIFEPHNKKLYEILSNHGYNIFPDWLSKYQKYQSK